MRVFFLNKSGLRLIIAILTLICTSLVCFLLNGTTRSSSQVEERSRPNGIRPAMPQYNLMEEKYGKKWPKNIDKYFSEEGCTIDYANSHQLQQDHPCVIHLIQKNYLGQPAPRSAPYLFDNFPKKSDPSDGQSEAILQLLQNKTNGFFIEAGANDGEFLSNTVIMEQFMNWTGLLVEADERTYKKMVTRNRKAYTLPGCLSTKPYPMKVFLNATHAEASYIVDEASLKRSKRQREMSQQSKIVPSHNDQPEVIEEVQCFPLYSILLAIGRTQIDFFSLDVEGAEYKILENIPWHKVDMTVLCVEWNHIPEGEPAMTALMERNNFIKFGFIELPVSRDVVYMKDYLANYRFLFYDDDEEV